MSACGRQGPTFFLPQALLDTLDAVLEPRLGGFELLKRAGEVLQLLCELGFDLIELLNGQRSKINYG